SPPLKPLGVRNRPRVGKGLVPAAGPPAMLSISLFVLAVLLPGTALSLSRESGVASGSPAWARPAVSAALGRNDPAYHAHRLPNGWRAANSRHGLQIDFSRGDVILRSGEGQLTFRLRGLGYGNTLRSVSGASPAAIENRIEYRRGNLTEWYVNGPLGLEQG